MRVELAVWPALTGALVEALIVKSYTVNATGVSITIPSPPVPCTLNEKLPAVPLLIVI